MLGHFPGPASSTVHGWLYGSSSVDREEAGTAKTPLVIRGDIAPETVCWHHEVGTWSKRNPNSHINNLWKRASNFFAHKKKSKEALRESLPYPSLNAGLSAVCLKAKVCWCLWFSSHRVSSFSLCLETASVTCSRSWFSPFQFIWLLGSSISGPTSELFSSCLSFSKSHLLVQ